MSSATTTEAIQPTVPRSDEVLRIANRDAMLVYRDVSEFRIVMELKPDGWHVDYELRQPLMAGGGPHYIIDAASGTIISKRYEQ